MPYQLPADAVPYGYKEVRAYDFEPVFYSAMHDFYGTEEEFWKEGFAYRYYDRNKRWRVIDWNADGLRKRGLIS